MSSADEIDGARHERDRPVAKLFDANGKLVGKLVYFYGAYVQGGVVLNVHAAPVYAGVRHVGDTQQTESATEMRWEGIRPIFAGPNCTGAVYVRFASGPLRPTALARSGATATLYVASVGRKQIVTVGSTGGVDPGECYTSDSPSQTLAWKVESTFDLTQHYPEPLRVGY